MSNCHSGKFSKTGGKCPTVSWQIFKNWRKMSDRHSGKFSKMGGKCPTAILANFQKWEENVQLSSWQIFKKWEENVRTSSWQIFKNGRKMSNIHSGKLSKNERKMSNIHSGKLSKTGGKCPTLIVANFQKLEENVQLSSSQIFKNSFLASKKNPNLNFMIRELNKCEIESMYNFSSLFSSYVH